MLEVRFFEIPGNVQNHSLTVNSLLFSSCISCFAFKYIYIMEDFMWKTGKKYIEGIYYDSEEVDYDSVPDFRESIYSRDNIGVFKEEPTTSIPVSQDIGGIPQDIRSGYIKDLTLT